MSDCARLLVVDLDERQRRWVLDAIAGLTDVSLEAVAQQVDHALELAQVLEPDVVLVSLDGAAEQDFSVAMQIREVYPAGRILILGSNGGEAARSRAFRNGAWGYLERAAWEREDLGEVIRAVASGNGETQTSFDWVSYWKQRLGVEQRDKEVTHEVIGQPKAGTAAGPYAPAERRQLMVLTVVSGSPEPQPAGAYRQGRPGGHTVANVSLALDALCLPGSKAGSDGPQARGKEIRTGKSIGKESSRPILGTRTSRNGIALTWPDQSFASPVTRSSPPRSWSPRSRRTTCAASLRQRTPGLSCCIRTRRRPGGAR